MLTPGLKKTKADGAETPRAKNLWPGGKVVREKAGGKQLVWGEGIYVRRSESISQCSQMDIASLQGMGAGAAISGRWIRNELKISEVFEPL